MNKKYLVMGLMAALLGTAVSIPVFASIKAPAKRGESPKPMLMGEESGRKMLENTNQIKGDFCSRFDAMHEMKTQRIQVGRTKLEAKRTEFKERANNRGNQRLEKLTELRNKGEEKRANAFKKLEENAATNEQKEAVEKFKLAIQDAIKIRHEVYSQERATFKVSVDAMNLQHKTGIDNVIASMKSEISAIEQKAKTDCNLDSVVSSEIRDEFRQTVLEIKNKFKNKRTSIDTVRNKVKDLTDDRKIVFDKAREDFKAAIALAKEELKLVFPVVGK